MERETRKGAPAPRRDEVSPARKADPRAPSADTPARARPTQARARFTLEAIVGAADELLRTQGVDAVTTRNVAARAGVSVGALYQYFPNKEAILIEISKRIMYPMG